MIGAPLTFLRWSNSCEIKDYCQVETLTFGTNMDILIGKKTTPGTLDFYFTMPVQPRGLP